MDEAALETPQTWAIATDKRKAWAKSRDSWQASEAEDVSTEGNQIAQAIEGKLQLGGEPGNIPNEKIAIWLKDCRTPLGASLDEQSNPAGFLRGMLLKNGGSFEDDLSLGAEANHLHQSNLPIEPICNGMLAKDRRLQYHQKGRSMNSTGSAKSSATVSSVSELLDLYEEDPEEILYNLGFGRDEPDIASKIPSRFFNSSSFARGIDIKVFLSAQMQRLEVENPNYALTSRFRQIEVLTTVANAFSSLYSQVSGTPLQRIGSSASLSTNKEPDKPAPLNRTTSQTASRLMKTLSKLNLYGTQPTGEGAISSPGTDNQGLTPKSNEDDANKTEKLQKPFKKNSPPLATVKEEASNSLLNVDTHSPVISLQLHEKLVDELAEACTLKQEESLSSQNECNTSSIIDLSPPKDIVSTDTESEINLEETSPHTSTPDKQLCTPLSNPSIKSLAFQTKDSSSFEMEEVQSTEEETSHIPSTCQSVLEKLSKDNLLRTASQHSDSSGFAEDPSSDCPLNSLQIHEPLQTMGSSADSCDSETTVTSVCDDLKTPLATDPPEPIDFEIDEFLTPIDLNESKVFFGTNQEISKENVISENQMGIYEDCKTQEELNSGAEINQDNSEEELQHQCTVESELETGSEYELVPYMTHHISESVDCFSDYDDGFHQLGKAETGSLERVNVALQRAQMKMISSETSRSKRGRSLVKSKDLLKRRHKLSDSGYPLRRTQSLPSEMLSPVRVVSKVNIVLSSGKATVCSPPTFFYKYSPEEQECMEPLDEEANTNYKSTLPISKKSEYKENSKTCLNRITDYTNPVGSQSSSMQTTSQRSHSSCSLHSLQSDWHERPLCEYARTWSTHSVPCFSGASCGALVSPYGCPLAQRLSCGSLNRSYSGYSLPAMSAPSTTEMQLRRVLHDIRNSLQNLSQHPLMRGSDGTTSGYNNQRPSVLPLYENTFQELQIMKRSLNLFRTQMMDLELNMLRQQTLVYQHLTDEERYEADQLQGLRNSVRMELQELELQLDERLMTLEEQLRNFHMSSPFHRSSNMGMYGSRSTDSLVFSSPLNVIEPVTELIREQTHLKTELGLGDLHMETEAEACESVSSRAASDTSSVCSGSPLKSRKGVTRSSDVTDILKPQTPPCKTVYRASVALTPSPPTRAGELEKSEVPENCAKLKMEPAEKAVPLALKSNEGIRRTEEENRELQQVIREIKESIVGDIRREIVSGLLAAVSSPMRSLDGKTDGRI